MELADVRVLNSEINTHYGLKVRQDRLRDFYTFVMANRKTDLLYMPGMSYAATLGVNTIFPKIPPKFPAGDILFFLVNHAPEVLGFTPDPPLTTQEIENALERFAPLHPQLYVDGSDIV